MNRKQICLSHLKKHMVKRLDESFETQIWFPFLQHQHHLELFKNRISGLSQTYWTRIFILTDPQGIFMDVKIWKGLVLKEPSLSLSLSLQVSWGISTWRNHATRSYIGIILILDFRKGDFCHTWHSPISLILTKHIIRNISLSPQLTLKFLLCSICHPLLFSHSSLSFTMVFCKAPLTSKSARMVNRECQLDTSLSNSAFRMSCW